ncbi:MAG: NAD(P)H-hydrate dehydratase, partial [Muribaculaceae bacterium]|nr:NAD(P)H-hydrate dehydratase [Muribaculaceae bacterium]
DMLIPDTVMARDRFVAGAGAELLHEVINPGVNFQMPEMDRSTIVVDGLFGSEHKKPLRGGYQSVARHINEHEARVIAIDLPSGMTPELSVGMINRNIVHAELTLTLVGPTLAFYMPENADLIGRWKTIEADYDTEAVRSTRCTSRVVDAKAVRMALPPRDPFASKADLGDVMLFAGSYGMLGAAVLATRAATRSGCGRVTCCAPRCAFYVMQSSVPSAMFVTDGSDFDIQRFEMPEKCDAIAIGPGLGHSDSTARGLEQFLKACHAAGKPIILDADALNCIASQPSMLDFLPPRSIITPHAGEFDRMFGAQSSHSTRVLKAMEVSARYKIVIVLKGHYTLTVWPDGSILVNTNASESLATAGSGDVLTGLMAGFLAQNMVPEIAAVAAVFIHGVAGKISARTMGIRGTTAEDIADSIGPAIESIVTRK